MSHALTAHAVNFNLRHHRKGHLFQNRFKSIVVEEDSYFLEPIRYIHLNPVRAGIVRSTEGLDAFEFTGHSTILRRRTSAPQDVARVLAMFSSNTKAAVNLYRDFVKDGFNQGRQENSGAEVSSGVLAALTMYWHAVWKGGLWDERILGGGEFVEAVLAGKESSKEAAAPDVMAILQSISSTTGITAAEILGLSGSLQRASNLSRSSRLLPLSP